MPYGTINPRRLHRTLSTLASEIYVPQRRLEVTAWVTKEPVSFEERTTGEKKALQPGDKWGELWDCAWFHFVGEVPTEAAGQKVVLLIDVNGELCLFDDAGTPTQGLTNVNSEFDFSLGKPGKRVVDIAATALGGEEIDLWGDAGCNDLFGRFRSGTLKEADIAICREEVRQLYYDFEVLLELAENLPEESARRLRVLQVLSDASDILTRRWLDGVEEARQTLAPELSRKNGDAPLTISAIGHAHIDLAWLWPIRETIRKGARTFSTALRMMEKYEDYVFGASQPQLYQWMKDRYPSLYSQVGKRIAEGRWEAQGAMWVEPDSNIAGGEALVRQVLYGKRFFQQEFGKDMKILWVPDIFGYSASLPQILKRSGVDYMMTQKLSWNEHNTYPHHSFLWEGIDGSQVLTHLPPEDTYNSPAAPRSIAKAQRQYGDSRVSSHCLMLYGIGDGGGGPGEEHLERLAREKNLNGIAPVVQEPSIDFFEKLSLEKDRFTTWRGELYLEKHQGTLTSQARNKRYNRRMEKSLRELEFAASLCQVLLGDEYPRDTLEEIWKEVLLYQFHDILPGSSITRVYTESLERYQVLYERVRDMMAERYGRLARSIVATPPKGSVLVVNSLPWERHERIEIDGKETYVTVPPMGYLLVTPEGAARSHADDGDALIATRESLENKHLRVSFAQDGTIHSLYDKVHGREVVLAGDRLNQLQVYHDHGNAWDFPENYRDVPAGEFTLTDVSVHADADSAAITQTYRYGESTLVQRIDLGAKSRRLDFRTTVDWRESNKMLRAEFPVSVQANDVACEIQFGHIRRHTHRNTSWDFAKDEICAHQWLDMSESNYGVALLNDCKYGHRANGHVLDINLLRSSSSPDPQADRAEHEFTYSLLPHGGSCTEAKVYQAGYELNVPLQVVSLETEATERVEEQRVPKAYSLLELDNDAIMVEAVKCAEDDSSMIVRLYETTGGRQSCGVTLHFEPEAVYEADLMENAERLLSVLSGSVSLQFGPFEIKTLKVNRPS